MRRITLLLTSALLLVSGIAFAPTASATRCNDGGPPRTDRVFTFTHGGDNFKPRLQIKYQTGGLCNFSGDYVWVKFIFNTLPGQENSYPVVNQNHVAKKVDFFLIDEALMLEDGAGVRSG
jgi:hypothetical protein